MYFSNFKDYTLSILGTIFRPLFATVLIGVNCTPTNCVISVVKKRGRRIVEESSKEFKIVNSEPSVEVIKYISKIKARYAYTYLSIISKKEQILIPGVKKGNFNDFGVNEKDYKVLKMPSAFICMLKQDIEDYQKLYRKAKGLDFLFSPYVLLFFKAKTFIGDNPKLFVLQEKEDLSVFIATRKEILYGAFLLMSAADKIVHVTHTPKAPSEDTLIAASSTEKGVDDLNTELSGLDEELADLDSFDFNSIASEANENISATSDSGESGGGGMDSLQDLGRSTGIINLLQASIKDFYHNSLYNGDFIEEIVIFDAYGISSQAIDNIRSNIMIDLSVVAIDLPKEIANLAQIELDS